GLPYALAYKRLMAMRNQLDLAAIQQLIKRQGLFPLGSLVAFEDGNLGFVKQQDKSNNPLVVRIVYNKLNNTSIKPTDLRLDLLPEDRKKLLPEDPAKYKLRNNVLLETL
ncbi:MAG: hypothetical protein GX029_00790, partial [Pseudomonadaceae bacterium]|nr:hypothetical protein [Pseudomonadaceae bacterium]